ncbi:Glu-tRNA(Gln) amidotransferase GatDE subunit D [archaeon]|nr:Glu-tRNA(Gln) amidotransferase GatDE subunit D [archaeon]|tara:strand:+ start:248 stop:1570 length:1323 start_codon:yes stop_codon:yes gene_type:complete
MSQNFGKPGDRVTLTLKNNHKESGIIVQSSKDNVTLLKLSTGYNVGFENEEIKEIKIIKKAKEEKDSKKITEVSISKDKLLPTISILHTGGTIASKVDYRTGGVVASFSPKDLINLFPELPKIANIESDLIAQMWSDDLRFIHMQKIVRAIEKKIKKGADGIIVGIGTDNLAVTAAAVSFMIEHTPIPILFVGSQRSSDRGSSDAAMNLICAAKFITKTDFAGVAICMHGNAEDNFCNILPATKTYKLHSSRRDAFQAVNSEPIAKVFYKEKKIDFLNQDYQKRNDKPAVIKDSMEEKVAILKIHTNMFASQFKAYHGFKGLILEGTGLGHIPLHKPTKGCEEHERIREEIKKLIADGTIMVMTTGCIFGPVNMQVYDKGRDLLELGVVSGKDMLASTAQVKLAWLLANETEQQKIKELMQTNLRGEISEKLIYTKDFTE